MKIGNKYTSRSRSAIRTLISLSECERFGYFKVETKSKTFFKWYFMNARQIEINISPVARET